MIIPLGITAASVLLLIESARRHQFDMAMSADLDSGASIADARETPRLEGPRLRPSRCRTGAAARAVGALWGGAGEVA